MTQNGSDLAPPPDRRISAAYPASVGVRFRRSIKLAPGVRLNVTKTGFGVTAGGKVARYSVHSSGRRTVGLGLPGTGTYYQQSSGGGSRSGTAARATNRQQVVQAVDPIQLIPKPGLLASVAERAYHRGLLSYLGGDYAAALESFEWVLSTDPAAASASLFAGIAANSIGDTPRAIKHLESVVGSANGLPDRYQAKFLPSGLSLTLAVRITDSVTAAPEFGELAATLALAELYQSAGRLEDAIGLLQQLHESLPDPLVRLSLCDLLYADADYDAVIETSADVINESDASVETMHLRGAAVLATEHPTAALETFTAALAKTSNRETRLLNAVRFDRAIILEQLGQQKRARADLERVYAADPDFEDVKERLASLP